MTPRILILISGSVLLALGGAGYLFWVNRWPLPVLRRIRHAWARGDHERANEILRALIPKLEERREYRHLATARLWMAAYCWENELTKQMTEHARRAVDEALVMGRPWQQLLSDLAYGWSLLAIGRAEEARKPLEAAELMATTMQAKPPRLFIRTGLGIVHWLAGNRALALDYARAACSDVAHHPQLGKAHPRITFELGQLCFSLGLWDEALMRFDETQAHTASGSLLKSRALLMHARIDLERGDFDRAAEVLESNLRRVPLDAAALRGWHHFYLARLHQLAKDPQPARLSLEQARMEAAHADTPELSCLIGLALTQQLRQQKQVAQAREILLRIQVELLSEEPGPLLAQTLLAWGDWFLDTGDTREAYAHFQLADRLLNGLHQPTLDPDLPYRLALLHHRMGLVPEGLKYEREGDEMRRNLGIKRPPPMRRELQIAS